MANFFLDTPDLVAIVDRLDLSEVVTLLERGYTEHAEHDVAPTSYEEAVEGYRAALELVGDLSANVISGLSASIDSEGASLVDGEVRYARGSIEAYRRLADAGVTGAILPRRFGGLNFPATVYTMMIEMVSRADASVMTMFGYQDVGEAIAHFGPEELAARLLPAFSRGEVIASMVLTEPDGGSDIAATRMRAFQDVDGQWRLRGTKQFISNGSGGLLLVLARTEDDTPGMFGLSLLASDGTGVKVTRVEEKMGLHGSPTCELVFDDAPAWLVGKRRMGMLHTLHTLNQARFSVAAQALGIADASYRSAAAYSHDRFAFGKPIRRLPAVAEMLVDMATTLEACRAMLYEGCRLLDRRNSLETAIERAKGTGTATAQIKEHFKRTAHAVDLLSPAVKYMVTEAAVRICMDAQQVFGGMGYMRDSGMEQRVRDVRVTTIYEGTSQVQASASMPGVMSDVLGMSIRSGENEVPEGLENLADRLKELTSIYHELRDAAATMSPLSREAAAGDLVDAYLGLWAGHLLFDQARDDDRKRRVAERWVASVQARARGSLERIRLGVHRHIEDLDIIAP
jgi:alkylation response protein AidB-like acyl-CoA dehydrogenase